MLKMFLITHKNDPFYTNCVRAKTAYDAVQEWINYWQVEEACAGMIRYVELLNPFAPAGICCDPPYAQTVKTMCWWPEDQPMPNDHWVLDGIDA